MRKSQPIKDLIPAAQQLLGFDGQGGIAITEAAEGDFNAIMFLGCHCLPTLVQGALFVKEYLPTTPAIATGGVGRGTILLRSRSDNFLMLQGLPALSAADGTPEALIMDHLFRQLGLPNPIDTECEAEHTAANFSRSKLLLEKNKAYPEGRILVIQAPCNRRRAQATGQRVLGGSVKVLTLDLPPVDLSSLGEKDLIIELYRLFGLRAAPQSELRVCAEFEPSVLDSMPAELRVLAEDTELRFHDCLENSPCLLDHVREAVLGTPQSVGGKCVVSQSGKESKSWQTY